MKKRLPIIKISTLINLLKKRHERHAVRELWSLYIREMGRSRQENREVQEDQNPQDEAISTPPGLRLPASRPLIG